MNFLKAIVIRVTLNYNKFQHLILTIFVLGLLDFIVYSDAVVAMFAFPEFIPIVLVVLLFAGTYKFLKHRVRTK